MKTKRIIEQLNETIQNQQKQIDELKEVIEYLEKTKSNNYPFSVEMGEPIINYNDYTLHEQFKVTYYKDGKTHILTGDLPRSFTKGQYSRIEKVKHQFGEYYLIFVVNKDDTMKFLLDTKCWTLSPVPYSSNADNTK